MVHNWNMERRKIFLVILFSLIILSPLWAGEMKEIETEHGNHRFGGAIGTQRSWKRIQPKKDEEGFMKVDENMELPFD